jgi:hypothetical protein
MLGLGREKDVLEVRMTSIVEQNLNPRMTFKCDQRGYMQTPVKAPSYCCWQNPM